MSRDSVPSIVRLVAAIGGVAAIALAAATIESSVEFGGSSGSGPGDGEDPGVADQPPSVQPVEPADTPAFLEYLFYALLIIGTIVAVWYLLTHRRDALRLIALCLVLALIVFVVVQGISEVPAPESVPEQPANGIEGGDGNGFGEDGNGSTATEPLFLILALVTAIVVGGLLLSRHEGSNPPGGDPADELEDSDDQSAGAAAVGSAAGRAADRIEDGTDVDNEIYRAWREMTRPLEVERPESSTPREFADAAIDAGIDPEHVEELTRLFEDVRYGHEEATPEMERRATTVLREIESAYAEAEDAAADSEGGSWGDRR